MGSERFPRAARLTTKAQFDRAFTDGARQHSALFRLHCIANAGAFARLGLALSRKLAPRAADRNRLRRHAREAFRRKRGPLAGWDLVLVPKPTALAAAGTALQADLHALFERVAALNRHDAVGTMARPAGA